MWSCEDEDTQSQESLSEVCGNETSLSRLTAVWSDYYLQRSLSCCKISMQLFLMRSSKSLILQVEAGSHSVILPSDLLEICSSLHDKIITCTSGKFSFGAWYHFKSILFPTGFMQNILYSLSKIHRGYIKVLFLDCHSSDIILKLRRK